MMLISNHQRRKTNFVFMNSRAQNYEFSEEQTTFGGLMRDNIFAFNYENYTHKKMTRIDWNIFITNLLAGSGKPDESHFVRK